jgi:hypothetical protein
MRVIREAIDDDVTEASDDTPKSLGSGVTNQGANIGEVEHVARTDRRRKAEGEWRACDRARDRGAFSVGIHAR